MSELTWTTARPTVAGWYWWRFNVNRSPVAIKVLRGHLEGTDVFTIGTLVLYLHEVPGEWQPVEPAKE
jgi:hypothetical protein